MTNKSKKLEDAFYANPSEFTYRHIDFYVLQPGDKFLHEGKSWIKIDEDHAQAGDEIQHFWPTFAAKLPKILTETEAVERWPILAYSL